MVWFVLPRVLCFVWVLRRGASLVEVARYTVNVVGVFRLCFCLVYSRSTAGCEWVVVCVCFENKLYSVDYYVITFFETIERYESCIRIVLYVITILHVGTHSPLMSRTTSLRIDRVGTCSLIHRHGASHRMPDAG